MGLGLVCYLLKPSSLHNNCKNNKYSACNGFQVNRITQAFGLGWNSSGKSKQIRYICRYTKVMTWFELELDYISFTINTTGLSVIPFGLIE